ncbi:hypothetical protein Tco_1395102, partial [Tanacetum coccineum]
LTCPQHEQLLIFCISSRFAIIVLLLALQDRVFFYQEIDNPKVLISLAQDWLLAINHYLRKRLVQKGNPLDTITPVWHKSKKHVVLPDAV